MQDVCNQDILIYRFVPHGSRNWFDLHRLFKSNKSDHENLPIAIFHDQELLLTKYLPAHPMFIKGFVGGAASKFSKLIVVHSQRSDSITKILDYFGAIDVYYWSHALIALDWFRYARVDPKITWTMQPTQKPFLIYNRAWSGLREYRLKFLELLIQDQQHHHANVKFSQCDNGLYYKKHIYQNSKFQTVCDFENHVEPNTSPSSASADYVVADYLGANIEVVLETIFDHSDQHLTEKTLRPIALGKPFILASSPGSLQYLRSYGFQTFDPWIDETYDAIQDPIIRMQHIVSWMKKFVSLDQKQQQNILIKCQTVADYNRQHFFSTQFFQTVVNEYAVNISRAISAVQDSRLA